MENQRKNDDKKLRSGERQVRSKLNEIDVWHLWRYNEALKYVTEDNTALDVGMGCGYGSHILASKAKEVVGIDDSEDAVLYAKKYWNKENIRHVNGNVLRMGDSMFDVIVAFEIIEHIKDYEEFIKYIKDLAKEYIVISVPHISVPLSKSKWHWKHFTEEEIKSYFEDKNWKIERLETPRFGKGKAVFAVIKRIKNEEEII